MSLSPTYRFVTRKQILAGCSNLTEAMLNQAILNRFLNPVLESNGTELFRGTEVEKYMVATGYDHSIVLRH